MSYVGTWDWALETEGSLRRQDRIRLIGQGVSARLERIPSQWRSKIFGEHASLRLPDPPDSALAREWYDKGASAGDDGAKSALKRLDATPH